MTKAQVNSATDVTPSVPSVGRTDSPSSSGSSLLKRFAKVGKVTPKATGKETREELVLTEKAKDLMLRYAPLKELSDIFSSRIDVESSELNAELMSLYIKAMWKGRGQPQNPAIKVARADGKTDAEGTFIVQEKLKINLPPIGEEEDPEHIAIQTLIDLGLEKLDAKNLVTQEMDFTPEIALDFTAQLHGKKQAKAFIAPNDLQKRAAEKLFLFLQGDEATLTLSDDERGSINITSKFKIDVKPGFLQRVCSYCHSEEQLKAVFQVITPVFYVKGAKIAVSDSLDDKNKRLGKTFNEVLGNR